MTAPLPRPDRVPGNPCFSSGPCAKRPGWSLAALEGAKLGRSHRAADVRPLLREVIDRSRILLGIPADWRLGIVPGSDTGAVEMAMWSLLGPRPVDVLAFDSFSAAWADDITAELRLPEVRVLSAPYGALPDLAAVDWSRDVVFAWNGTTSGVRMPGAAAIPPRHDGLAICDATSAAFAMDLPWDRLDVVTWSWQKVLGGEAAHGMLALSPRAAARLTAEAPDRPLPRVFRLARHGKLAEGVFAGDTINTPSMLCVADALDGLRWAEAIGGLPALINRSRANLAAVAEWVARTPWVRFLASDPAIRSSTAICLALEPGWFGADTLATEARLASRIAAMLAAEGVAFDIGAYRDAPAGLRLWGGATVDAEDLRLLLPWLDWAAHRARAAHAAVSVPGDADGRSGG